MFGFDLQAIDLILVKNGEEALVCVREGSHIHLILFGNSIFDHSQKISCGFHVRFQVFSHPIALKHHLFHRLIQLRYRPRIRVHIFTARVNNNDDLLNTKLKRTNFCKVYCTKLII